MQKKVDPERARQMRAEGYSLNDIAKEFGVSIGTIYAYVRDITPRGRKIKKRGMRLSQKEIEEICELRKRGLSGTKIAEKLGIHYLTVYKYLKKCGGSE